MDYTVSRVTTLVFWSLSYRSYFIALLDSKIKYTITVLEVYALLISRIFFLFLFFFWQVLKKKETLWIKPEKASSWWNLWHPVRAFRPSGKSRSGEASDIVLKWKTLHNFNRGCCLPGLEMPKCDISVWEELIHYYSFCLHRLLPQWIRHCSKLCCFQSW